MTPAQPIPRKLNLGCGKYKLPGYLNADSWPAAQPDVFLDLDELPLPFPDNSFDEVRADHVLEHLDNPFGVMLELHRICQAGALIKIKVPHFSRGMTHADHKRGFDVSFPYYFNPGFRAGFLGCHMDLVKQRLRWFGQPYMKKSAIPAGLYWLGRCAGAIIDVFANLSPILCSRVWCFWVGGFEEYKMHFLVVKPPVSEVGGDRDRDSIC
jgi:SAM-dependent methyltransferase